MVQRNGRSDAASRCASSAHDRGAGKDGSTPRSLIVPATDVTRARWPKGTSATRAVCRLCGRGAPARAGADADGTAFFHAPARGAGRRLRRANFGKGVVDDDLSGDPPKARLAFADGERVLLASSPSPVD